MNIAKEKYNYNMEQALGMLCWHKFDLKKAAADLPNFTPFPDEWTVEDKVLFEQAFQFHDKHFHKIRQMVRSCSISISINLSFCSCPISQLPVLSSITIHGKRLDLGQV